MNLFRERTTEEIIEMINADTTQDREEESKDV